MSGLSYYSLLLALCCSIVASAQSLHGDREGNLQTLPAFQIEALPDAVNESYQVARPIVAPSGQFLFFSRDKHPQNVGFDNKSDVWVAYPNHDQQWSRAIHVGAPVNDRKANQVVSVSADEDTIYLTQNFNTLSWATRQGRLWSRPVPMVIQGIPKMADIADMHVSADGQVLLLAMRGPNEDFDLFVSLRKDSKTWSTPQDLGAVINSKADEKGVTLAYDNQTIFFSSNGHGGEGGQDIFQSQRVGDSWTSWSTPKNLGPGLNTPKDEQRFSLTASGEQAFWCMANEAGVQKIYTISLPALFRPQSVTLLSGQLLTPISSKAEIALLPLDGSASRPKTITVAPDGSFQTIIPAGTEIGLVAKADGYLAWNDLLPWSEASLEELDDDQGTMTASLHNDPGYLQRNEEIQALQLKLEQLTGDLDAIQEQREAYLKKLADDRAQYAAMGIELPKNSDPELDALVFQYEHYINNFEEAEEVLAQRQQDQYLQDTIIPTAQVEASVKEDDELEELRRRFNAFHQQTKADQAKNDTQEDTLLWDRPMSYDDFQAPPDMQQQVTPKGVPSALIEEARRELETEVDPAKRALLKAQEERLKKQIAMGFSKAETAESWEDQLQPEAVQPLTPPPSDWEEALKEDIKKAMKTEISYQEKASSVLATRQALETKIQLQIQSEKAAGITTSGQTDDVAQPTNTATAKTNGFQKVNKNISLTPIQKGQTIQINTIFFKPNTAELKTISTAGLDYLFTFLKEHPTLVAEIGVHTNGWMSHALSMELSAQRANTIKNQLIARGIRAERIMAAGYGKTKPIATNDTLEGRRLNQRIELVIIEE
jgi:outer membrane protein OmpA-like peptidoglycan-associated protein